MAISTADKPAVMLASADYDIAVRTSLQRAIQGTPAVLRSLPCDAAKALARLQRDGQRGTSAAMSESVVAVLVAAESDEDPAWQQIADAMSLLKWHGRPRGIHRGMLTVRWANQRIRFVGAYSPYAGTFGQSGPCEPVGLHL